MVLVIFHLACEAKHALVLLEAHHTKTIQDGISFFVKTANLVQDTGLGIGVGLKVELVDIVLLAILIHLLVYIHLTCTISIQVDIVNTILELECHLISMLMQWLLDDVLLRLGNLVLELLATRLIHDLFVVTSPDCECIGLINGLIQELGTLVV